MDVVFDAALAPAELAPPELIHTFSFTVTSNGYRHLLVFVALDGTSAGVISGVTYAGVAMSFVEALESGFERLELWELVAPATGANNVVVTQTALVNMAPAAISFYGVDQAVPRAVPHRSSAGTALTSRFVFDHKKGDMIVSAMTIDLTADITHAALTGRWDRIWFDTFNRHEGATGNANGEASATGSAAEAKAHIAVCLNAARALSSQANHPKLPIFDAISRGWM